ncbi:hypothetical protein ACIRN4_06665 [Pimelobacter simplex]|uniref:hypothetical protein n=1 Tax=Nocardioides simplex TaxID=2045 RepID=UPI0037F54737
MSDLGDQARTNDAVVAAHRAALARGERRVLRLTRTGTLHSYERDEIGVGPVASGRQVTSWWGLSFLAALMWACFAASWLIILGPTADGGRPAWGGLAVSVMGAAGGAYATRLAREEYRARAARRRRGVPEPSGLPVPTRWADPVVRPPRGPHPRAGRWRLRPWWWIVPRSLLTVALVLAVVGATTDRQPTSAGVLAVAGTGLVLTVVLPVALAARRVARARVSPA